MVIIKNMETIPKGCKECKLCVEDYISNDGWFGVCVLNEKLVNYSDLSRDIDCPLQETKPVKIGFLQINRRLK